MKAAMFAALCVLFCAGTASAQKTKAQTTLKTQVDSISYIAGLSIGKQMARDSTIKFNIDVVAQGMRDALAGKPALTEAQMNQVMQSLQMSQMRQLATRNKSEGAAFLAANAKKPGVTTLPSGVQYQVLEKGAGISPAVTDTVVVNYRGTLLDGTVFDETTPQRGPATFPVGGVIPAWTEVLQLMKPGDKWTVWIPSHLAYGENGAGGQIGPNATLVFDIELLSFKKAQ